MDNDLRIIRRMRGLPGDKSLAAGLCNYTSRVINIDPQGRVFICLCEAWLPWAVGNVMDFNDIESVFRSAVAVEIRQSQDAGAYSFCDTTHCEIAQFPRHSDGIQLYIGIDDSCQLACPSCRKEKFFESENQAKAPWIDRIVSWVQSSNEPVRILIGAHGDPLASPFYRSIIGRLRDPRVTFQLKTNGLLLYRYLDELGIASQISELEISIDAATADTYQNLRRPAHWEDLERNLEYLRDLRTRCNFDVKANFVVQQGNFQEMPGFVDFCDRENFTPMFMLLQDWHTIDHRQHAVHRKQHLQHREFLAVLKDPKVVKHIGNRFDHWTT